MATTWKSKQCLCLHCAFFNFLMFCLFACHFLSSNALSSQGHRSFVSDKNHPKRLVLSDQRSKPKNMSSIVRQQKSCMKNDFNNESIIKNKQSFLKNLLQKYKVIKLFTFAISHLTINTLQWMHTWLYGGLKRDSLFSPTLLSCPLRSPIATGLTSTIMMVFLCLLLLSPFLSPIIILLCEINVVPEIIIHSLGAVWGQHQQVG